MAENGIDASKLTVPVILVVGMIGLGFSGAWWASGLSSGQERMTDSLEKMDRRISGIEVNVNAAFAEQRAVGSTVSILQERQNGIGNRQDDMAQRLLQLENWQRQMNAREQR